MSDTISAEILTDEEAKALERDLESLYGIAPTATAPREHPNAALNSLFNNFGAERKNNRGHRIIDYEDYVRLDQAGYVWQEEVVTMKNPENGSISTVPCRKYQKYYGQGLRPVLRDDLKPKPTKNVATKEAGYHKIFIGESEYNVFLCNEQYPGCRRLFDSAHGRTVHQKTEHEKAWSRKRKTTKEE